MKTEGNKIKLADVSKGTLLAFASGAMLSCVTTIVKLLTNIHPGQLAIYRHWAGIGLSLPFIIWSGENLLGPPGYRSYVALRSVLTAVSLFCQFLTFRYLPVGEAAVLISTTPVFITIAAKFFLKEPFGLLQIISLLTTTTGIVLITGLQHTGSDNPRIYTTDDIYGFSLGMVSVVSLAITYIITRKCKNVSANVFLLNTSSFGIVGSAILTPIIGSYSLNYRGLQQVLIIILGLVSYLALMGSIVALKYLEAGPMSTMRFSADVLLSFLWQIFFFAHVPDTGTFVGVVLVLTSIFLLGFRNKIADIFHSEQFKKCHSFLH